MFYRPRSALVGLACAVSLILGAISPGPVLASPAAPDSASLTWTDHFVAPSPPPSGDAGLVYDAANKTVVLLGGQCVGSAACSDDTWVWDSAHWTRHVGAPALPPGTGAPLMVYDDALRKVLVFGADGAVWDWDGDRWNQESGATPGLDLSDGHLAYDARNNTVVFFGGAVTNGIFPQETWTWDGTRWTQQHPAIAPPGRSGAAMAYDPATGKIVFFGGYNNYLQTSPISGGKDYNDTWTWDGESWTEQHPTTSPPSIWSGRMVFDPALNGLLLFGGVSSFHPSNESWLWNGHTWSQLNAPAVPPARSDPGLAFDAANGTVVLFGGEAIDASYGPTITAPPTTPYGDTWTFGPPVQTTVPHDARYFAQTGFRIDNDTIWDYFNRRGGVATFGYPVSRTFVLNGYPVQFFQRRIVQLDQAGQARLLNLLDPATPGSVGFLPYDHFNGASFPPVDHGLLQSAPSSTDPIATLNFVRQTAPNVYQGKPVNFYQTFLNTVPMAVAFPNGGDPNLLPGIDLEMWGIPTSRPMVDPHNHNFIYQRFQRGIMMYDTSCNCTQGVLLADYFKSVIEGTNLPADLRQEAMGSPYYQQYDPGQPNWVRDPTHLTNTDLISAFTPE